MANDLETSKRFDTPKERRDFLGLAAIWSAAVALGVSLLGALRLPIPSVLPESSSRIKLGPLETFSQVTVKAVPEHRLWVFRDEKGLYAISAICTHLGCIVSSVEEGGYFCPCHGSRFDGKGKVVAGPAPKRLDYLSLFVSPDGQLVVDRQQTVEQDVRLEV